MDVGEASKKLVAESQEFKETEVFGKTFKNRAPEL